MPQLPPSTRSPSQNDVLNHPTYAKAEINGNIIPGRVYRIQVGSFKVAKNAVDVFDRLTAAGLNPQWEPYEDYYRVVITNIRAENIPQVAVTLGKAGFSAADAREETQR
ncbi:MAG: SPOR domain-containing protein [Spirochaetaceae bacterium]|nr:SPOR domain-containing protein [Spirochaetaceae bacterium]